MDGDTGEPWTASKANRTSRSFKASGIKIYYLKWASSCGTGPSSRVGRARHIATSPVTMSHRRYASNLCQHRPKFSPGARLLANLVFARAPVCAPQILPPCVPFFVLSALGSSESWAPSRCTRRLFTLAAARAAGTWVSPLPTVRTPENAGRNASPKTSPDSGITFWA